MNYIFLDIDGVLNYEQYFHDHVDDEFIIDPEKVKLLSDLVHDTKAKIILSSSWRYGFDQYLRPIYPDSGCAKLKELFKKYNIKISGRTQVIGDYDGGYRPDQVKKYIKKHLKPGDHFVIFDDEDWCWADPVGFYIFGDNFIRTEWKSGITEKNAKFAEKILNGEV